MKTQLRLATVAALLLVCIAASCRNQSIAADGSVPASAARDFPSGRWAVAGRQLKSRQSDGAIWEEFPGRLTLRPIPNGRGFLEEVHFTTHGRSGAMLRLYDPRTRQWSIFWIDGREGLLWPPAVGGFRDGMGEFFGEEIDEGRAARVRYRWQRGIANTARWEKAYSVDGGRTWETRWVMDLLRLTN